MNVFFSTLKKQANSRAKEATLSVLGINNPNLRNHLNNKMETDEQFIHGPVFEQMFSWERNTDYTMQDLVQKGLLSQEVVDALDSKNNGRYVFDKTWSPFKHQYKAWNDLLSSNIQSRIITSGTGSGKTECFMVPVLEDLYSEVKTSKQQLEGVHAIFLYPLNALINSQQERLNAWTQHFNGDIRFCLFNGKTPEYLSSKARQIQKSRPQEVMCREGLRESPAPILVTNGTMLEYMLVRQTDAPIIEKSKGKLRWIILDEAHTYVGSQAAELALQLRRVMQAFEVKAEDIRFVATSATIAGAAAEDNLKKYLASLANISVDQVDVIGGRRVVPALNSMSMENLTLEEIEQIEPQGVLPDNKKEEQDPHVSKLRYLALESSEVAVAIREMLTAHNTPPKTIYELKQALSKFDLSENNIYKWIDVCTGTKPSSNAEAFLKLRAHYFQRTLEGLWSCIDKNCEHKKHSELKNNWPFGTVYSKHKMHCDCGAPVLELTFCNECNEPHLLGVYDNQSYVQQWVNRHTDEFALTEGEREDLQISDSNDESDIISADRTSQVVVFSGHSNEEHDYYEIDVSKDGKISKESDKAVEHCEIVLAMRDLDGQECVSCGFTGKNKYANAFRRAMLGAPFYTTNAVPTILEYCPDFEPDKYSDIKQLGPNELPARGRRLITFTDSRQGTAKISVSMQQEAERSHFRGTLVRELRKHVEEKLNIDPQLLDKVKEYQSMSIETLRLVLPQIKQVKPEDAVALDTYFSFLEAGKQTKPVPMSFSWKELINVLKNDENIANSMTQENHYFAPEVFELGDATKLSEMILTREIARRPKNRNNVETQGLVKLIYPGIESIKEIPEKWAEHNFTLQDWKDYLKVCMDFFVRENTYVSVSSEISRWVGMHFYPKLLISPDSKDKDENRVKSWPLVKSGKKRQQRIVMLLAKAAKFKAINKIEEDTLNTWLRAAWIDLVKTKTLNEYAGKQYQLDLSSVEFSLLTHAYICPITNKLIDTVFSGITPYLPWNKELSDYTCELIELPSIWEFDTSSDVSNFVDDIRKNVAGDSKVKQLREQNLWTDINDRALEGGFYYTTAEHSAQQSSDNLERYEEMFKQGKKNVLNCSTTMEMGVDIGGISAVVMNNVPPHPANYLQRAGRAGRSSESRAIGFTICKNNPHDQYVFNQPLWPFITVIQAPTVTFSSEKLVQRHVNSLLLGTFLRDKIGTTKKEKLFLNLSWFYLRQDGNKAVYEQFIDWVKAGQKTLKNQLSILVQGTILSDSSEVKLCADTNLKVQELASRWLNEHSYIQTEMNGTEAESPYGYKLSNDLKRLENEYLLRDLATRGFLPGYGFPTDVVNLSVDSLTDYIRQKEQKNSRSKDKIGREDNVSLSRGMPSRNLAVAIREFAPGTELVLDGRVHKSAGISLNWQNIHVEGGKDSQKFDIAWRCDCCGQTGYEADLAKQSEIICSNSQCASNIKLKNQRRVIQPTGFVVDYYHPPTNNIASTHYVPVQQPWVIGKGAYIPLPNPELGYMVNDNAGHVFHYCSGLHGKGYGICLSCGKAESMTSTSELPPELSLQKAHRPPMPNKFQRDEKGKPECDSTGKILEGIHLGYNSTTDVFELILRNPNTSEYLAEQSIAVTIAVAIRKALVETLGISVNEVGYSTRLTLIEKSQQAYAIQLFDMVSGGAGFATSAKEHIAKILEKTIAILDCVDNCERFCHKCLLESDSRHDIDQLNRKLAFDWINKSIRDYIALPVNCQKMLGSDITVKYVASSLKEKLSELIRMKPDTLKFVFSKDSDDWDTSLAYFKSLFHSCLAEEVNIQIIIPDEKLNEGINNFLAELDKIGVKIFIADIKYPVIFQSIKGDVCTTVANADEEATRPGENWLNSNDITVQTNSFSEIKGQSLSFELIGEAGAVEIPTLRELNGPLAGFGVRLLNRLTDLDDHLKNLLSVSSLQNITYTDRYIQSPTSMMMLCELLSALAKGKEATIEVKTCFADKKGQLGYAIQHDWAYEDDYKSIFGAWLQHNCSPKAQLIITDKHKVPHRRTLTLEFDSGDKVTVTFDQGLGYWRVEVDRGLHKLDFKRDPKEQLACLCKAFERAKVTNSADWETWFTVSSVK